MFHLSLPVARFRDCLSFYRSCFDADVVELGPGVANLFVFGAQITLHDCPDALPEEARRQIHFGQVVPAEQWLRIRDRLRAEGHALLKCVEFQDAPNGRAKLLTADPSGNLVEINAL